MRFKRTAVVGALSATLIFPLTALGQDTYIVESGDTLNTIAGEHGVSVEALMEENSNIQNPNVINVGQSIAIPESESSSSESSSAETSEAVSSQSESEFEQEVVRLTNEVRAENGLEPVEADSSLQSVADAKSQDMIENDYFAHESPTYGSPFEMMQEFGVSYDGAGENIAAGQDTPQDVVDAWMDSPGHRDNILNPDFTHIAIGYEEGGEYGQYWTQMFLEK
ncbi:CAP domain-containing protein [uncultured Marinococcus sp.]|uniref:CAP domain-containing protein n=1 Tax=uncultured Marinococcus sp. TaxID=487012 RepID=UPI00261C559E|nr:CAP domain-containing protein [uncultured Marinococcus sp.]